jgi:hypothetical protein
MMTVDIVPCLPPWPNPDSTITILHPGYSGNWNRLVMLPALDGGGVHYGTALTICGISTGNTFNTGVFAKVKGAGAGAQLGFYAQWVEILLLRLRRQVKYAVSYI